MKFELKPLHRNTPLDVLLDDVRQAAARLGKNTITITDYRRHGAYHATTVSRRIGTWNKVLEKAGLRISKPHNVPVEELIDNLRNAWLKLGRQPSYTDMRPPLCTYGAKPYIRVFGTWRKALEKFIEFVNAEETTSGGTDGSEMSAEYLPKPNHKTSRNVNWRLRFLTMKRDNFRCAACGTSPANDPGVILHVDHIHPWDKGGETVSENLQTLCSVCNIGKGNTGELAETQFNK